MAVVAASVSLVAGCGMQKVVAAPGGLSVGRFNGLKACPLPKMRAVVCRPSGVRRLSIRGAANPKTLQTVQDIVATQLSVKKELVHPGATFVDLGADSLDTVELMMALEETFSINLDEEGAQKISTVQEAADMIQITIDDAQ